MISPLRITFAQWLFVDLGYFGANPVSPTFLPTDLINFMVTSKKFDEVQRGMNHVAFIHNDRDK